MAATDNIPGDTPALHGDGRTAHQPQQGLSALAPNAVAARTGRRNTQQLLNIAEELVSTISAKSKLSGQKKVESVQLKALLRDAAKESLAADHAKNGKNGCLLTGVACDLLFVMEPLLRDL